jgi:hypothetical protein
LQEEGRKERGWGEESECILPHLFQFPSVYFLEVKNGRQMILFFTARLDSALPENIV